MVGFSQFAASRPPVGDARDTPAMRALVVTVNVPDPEGTAAGRCAVALLQGLEQRGVEVRALAALLPWDRQDAQAAAGLDVETLRVTPGVDLRSRIERYTRPRAMLATGAFRERVRTLAADVDAVFLEDLDTARIGGELDRPNWVANMHCLTERDQPKAPLRTDEGRARLELLRAERWLYRHAPEVVVNAEAVARDVRRGTGAPVTVVPLGLDPAGYVPVAPTPDPVAGLIGTAAWPPTADSVVRVVDRVWPKVAAALPQARLRLAGRGMLPATFPAVTAGPGVEWVGPVDVAHEFFAGLGVLLYPLGNGSGMKVKVVEALALGIPVVTTTEGAEGIAEGDGVIVSDDDDELARATIRLLGDPQERARRGAAARAMYEERHAPGAVADRLIPVLQRAAERR